MSVEEKLKGFIYPGNFYTIIILQYKERKDNYG